MESFGILVWQYVRDNWGSAILVASKYDLVYGAHKINYILTLVVLFRCD